MTRLPGGLEIRPVTDADLTAVAELLHQRFNRSIAPRDWSTLFRGHWDPTPPHHGMMLVRERRILGVIGTLHSHREIDGHPWRQCNLHSWFVEDDHRNGSLPLLMAATADPQVLHFVLTPNDASFKAFRFLKFQPLETRLLVWPNLPWPGGSRARGVSDPGADGLPPAAARIIRDHARAPGLHHVLWQADGTTIHAAWRRTTWRGWSCAQLLHLEPAPLPPRFLCPLLRRLLGARVAFTLTDGRFLQGFPFATRVVERALPTLFRLPRGGPDLPRARIGNLYSELALLHR
ncbi:MAG: hypothetical protein HQL82_15500 [Magnetococcales bacterium]|nr:hypothetical protein [Magnetococcales bacterium]